MKSSPRWIDPGDHLPWLLPAPEEPPDRDEQPDRQQLDILTALATLTTK